MVDRGRTDSGEFAAALAAQSPDFAPVVLNGDDPFIVLFTSGTTSSPKGIRYPLKMLIPIAVYMCDGVDLQPEDRFWNLADPGWGYGMLYAVVGPLLLGHATTFYEGVFTVETTLRVIAEQQITNLAAAPTVYRLMMAAGDAAVSPIAGRLRIASSAGEPLTPAVVRWGDRVLHVTVKDHYGQSETAMLANNHHGLYHQAKVGSVGLAMPGFSLAVLDEQLRPVPPGTPGILAVNRKMSPLCFFEGYLNGEAPTLQGDWHLTGDTMRQDADDICTSSDEMTISLHLPAIGSVPSGGRGGCRDWQARSGTHRNRQGLHCTSIGH